MKSLLLFLSLQFVGLSFSGLPAHFECPDGYAGRVTHPECCDEYFICEPGKEMRKESCNDNKMFDSTIFECVGGGNVRCEDEYTYKLEDGHVFIYVPQGLDRFSWKMNSNSNLRTSRCSNSPTIKVTTSTTLPPTTLPPTTLPPTTLPPTTLSSATFPPTTTLPATSLLPSSTIAQEDEKHVEWDKENVHVKTITLNLNINTLLDKIVVHPEPEKSKEPENLIPNTEIETEPKKKKKKKVKVNLNIENPDQIEALVNKDKGRQLVQKLMDSIPKSEHQEEIAKIFSKTVHQAIENLKAEKAKQGPNFFNGKVKLSLVIDNPKHVEALIQEGGVEKMEDKLRNELSDNEMTILDSIWGAVRRSAAKNR